MPDHNKFKTNILKFMKQRPGQSFRVGELAMHLGIAVSYVQNAVDALKLEGLVLNVGNGQFELKPQQAPVTNDREKLAAQFDGKYKADHDNDELIEEIKAPGWLAVAISTNRPQLLGINAPETLDAADTVFVLNALRVYMLTNESLRQRLNRREAQMREIQNAVVETRKTARLLAGALDALTIDTEPTEGI